MAAVPQLTWGNGQESKTCQKEPQPLPSARSKTSKIKPSGGSLLANKQQHRCCCCE